MIMDGDDRAVSHAGAGDADARGRVNCYGLAHADGFPHAHADAHAGPDVRPVEKLLCQRRRADRD